MLDLYRILALNILIHDCGDIYRAGYCNSKAIVYMQKAQEELLYKVQPYMLILLRESVLI